MIAGIVAYFGIRVGIIGVIFIVAGGSAIALAISGHKTRGGDVVLFVVSLLVLAAAGTSFPTPGTSQVNYLGERTSIQVNQIDVSATTDLGSVEVVFSSSQSAGYEVTFSRSTFFGLFPFMSGNYTFSNETSNGVLHLVASAASADIRVTIGAGFRANVQASSATGSVSLSSSAQQLFGSVNLSSNTGSVSANLASATIGSLTMNTNTGSVDLTATSLAASGAKVPIRLSANTGSVSVHLRIPATVSMSLNATTSLGSVSHELPGFTISESTGTLLSASIGEVNTAGSSFIMSASTDTGSVSLDVQRLG